MSECRICLNTSKGKLLAPCRCSGSIKYIHQNCLAKWVKEKYPREFNQLLKNSKTNQVQIKCELCKYNYKTSTNYLNILEICRQIKDSNYTYSILINIPVIVFLIYKCNYMLRHLFLFIYSHTLKTNTNKALGGRVMWIFKAMLGLFIRLLPIGLVGTILPLFIHSTAKLMKQLWMEFKDIKFLNLVN